MEHLWGVSLELACFIPLSVACGRKQKVPFPSLGMTTKEGEQLTSSEAELPTWWEQFSPSAQRSLDRLWRSVPSLGLPGTSKVLSPWNESSGEDRQGVGACSP